MFIRAGDSGRSLLTGDRCSEVAVSTGLTVVIQIVVQISFRMVVKIAIVQHVIQILCSTLVVHVLVIQQVLELVIKILTQIVRLLSFRLLFTLSMMRALKMFPTILQTPMMMMPKFASIVSPT